MTDEEKRERDRLLKKARERKQKQAESGELILKEDGHTNISY